MAGQRGVLPRCGNPAPVCGGQIATMGKSGTLLTQTGDPLTSGAVGAWVHGRAAEIVQDTDSLSRATRGHTLGAVLDALSLGWPANVTPLRYPVLLELPAIGERR